MLEFGRHEPVEVHGISWQTQRVILASDAEANELEKLIVSGYAIAAAFQRFACHHPPDRHDIGEILLDSHG